MTEQTPPAVVPCNVRATDKTRDFEIIQVKAGVYERTHVILIETSRDNHLEYCGDRHYGNASILVRAIYMSGDAMRPGEFVGDMGGRMDSNSRSVKLTNGGVIIPGHLRNLHIGSFMFNKIIAWAQEFDENYTIVPISVVAGDAMTSKDKGIRNTFYENAGLRFIWSEGKHGLEGRSDPRLTVADLKLRKYWPNIERDYHLGAVESTWRELALAKDQVKGLRAANRYYRRKINHFHGRMRIAMSIINYPMYGILFLVGLGAGRGMEWVRETFPAWF